jgi:serine/threonine protein kinase
MLCWKQIPLIEREEDRIKKEVEIVKGIHSPYVVNVLDSFVDDKFLYVVMELNEGGTLATIVDDLVKSDTQIDENVCIHIFSPLFTIVYIFFCSWLILECCFIPSGIDKWIDCAPRQQHYPQKPYTRKCICNER